MKKMLGICIISALLPAMMFAELSIGPAAFLKSPVLIGQNIDVSALNVNQFSFGGDVRYRLGILQLEGLMLYSAGSVQSLNFYLDGGISIDILMLSLSLGAGPNFIKVLNHDGVYQTGFNAKAGADIQFEHITVGASYIMDLNVSNAGISLRNSAGLLGLHMLFKL